MYSFLVKEPGMVERYVTQKISFPSNYPFKENKSTKIEKWIDNTPLYSTLSRHKFHDG